MNWRLHKAAIRGDVNSLPDLLNQDKHILDGVRHDLIANENPVHVAAQFGHVDFAKEILNLKPEYAHKLNSQGQSPLHLASGAGHEQVVKLLLQKEKDVGVCFVRDKRGRTPLHIAAMKGRLEVLNELVLAEPTAAWVLTHEREPILHLCANHNQFGALKLLIHLVDDDKFANMKDDADNSILHLLALEIQTEVIDDLLRNDNIRRNINALNLNKHTPLDALVNAPRKSGYRKCRRILRQAGGKRAKEFSQARSTSDGKNTWKAHADWLNETKSTLMVVAILIATVTFGAVLNPPGGVWPDNYPPDPSFAERNQTKEYDQWTAEIIQNGTEHIAGEAIMSYEHPVLYLLINISNQVGFLASASAILLLISGFNLRRRKLMWALMIAMWIAIGSMVLSYGLAFLSLTNPNAFYDSGFDKLHPTMVVISFFGSLVLIGPLVAAHAIRLVIPLLKKSRNLFKRRAGCTNGDGVAIPVRMDQS